MTGKSSRSGRRHENERGEGGRGTAGRSSSAATVGRFPGRSDARQSRARLLPGLSSKEELDPVGREKRPVQACPLRVCRFPRNEGPEEPKFFFSAFVGRFAAKACVQSRDMCRAFFSLFFSTFCVVFLVVLCALRVVSLSPLEARRYGLSLDLCEILAFRAGASKWRLRRGVGGSLEAFTRESHARVTFNAPSAAVVFHGEICPKFLTSRRKCCVREAPLSLSHAEKLFRQTRRLACYKSAATSAHPQRRVSARSLLDGSFSFWPLFGALSRFATRAGSSV